MVIGLNALGTTLGITEITPAISQPVLMAYATSNTALSHGALDS